MEPERFKRTMKARGHWQDGELTSAEPAVLVDDRGSVTLNEPAKGYWVDGAPVWPAYNPVTGEDLLREPQEMGRYEVYVAKPGLCVKPNKIP